MSFMDKVREFFSGDDWTERDAEFAQRHATNADGDYDRYRPAYQYGYAAGATPENRGRAFEDVEPDLRTDWRGDDAERVGDWDSVRGYARDAYARGQEQVITLAEEQLAVGKRTVPAGEVSVRKHVETEHVSQTVPLMRDEVTVERRPVADGRLADADIGEQDITVNLTAEEAIVEKRPVVKEEIVVTKQAVQDDKTITADLRRERADVDDNRTDARGDLRGDRIDSRDDLRADRLDETRTDARVADARVADTRDNARDTARDIKRDVKRDVRAVDGDIRDR